MTAVPGARLGSGCGWVEQTVWCSVTHASSDTELGEAASDSGNRVWTHKAVMRAGTLLVLGTVFDQRLEAVSSGGVDGTQGEVNEAGLDEPLGADLLLAGPVPGHLGGGALLPGDQLALPPRHPLHPRHLLLPHDAQLPQLLVQLRRAEVQAAGHRHLAAVSEEGGGPGLGRGRVREGEQQHGAEHGAMLRSLYCVVMRMRDRTCLHEQFPPTEVPGDKCQCAHTHNGVSCVWSGYLPIHNRIKEFHLFNSLCHYVIGMVTYKNYFVFLIRHLISR